jgi:hypothetical protein
MTPNTTDAAALHTTYPPRRPVRRCAPSAAVDKSAPYATHNRFATERFRLIADD